MNQYGSETRRVWFSNVVNRTISPPNNLDISGLAVRQVGIIPLDTFNPNSSIVIKSIGLYSNFSDGLVFIDHNPVIIEVRAFRVYPPNPGAVGDMTCAINSRNATGNFTGMVNGDIIAVLYTGLDGYFPHYIDNIGPGTADLRNFPYNELSTVPIFRLSVHNAGISQSRVFSIQTLNDQYPVESFAPFLVPFPADLYPDAQGSIVLDATILLDTQASSPYEFLTKSISPDFDGDTVFFSIAADIEGTV